MQDKMNKYTIQKVKNFDNKNSQNRKADTGKKRPKSPKRENGIGVENHSVCDKACFTVRNGLYQGTK